MLLQGQIETIKGLLAQGTSQRQVHALTGFSRTVISDIADGRRPDYEAIRRAKAEQSCVSDCPPTRCPLVDIGCNSPAGSARPDNAS